MNLRCLLIVTVGLASGYASAQVYRCPDAKTGQVAYSDQPCSHGTQILKERSPDQQQMDAERAAVAQERFQLQQERRAMQERPQVIVVPPSPGVPTSEAKPINRYECDKAERELALASSIRTLSEYDKRMRVNAAIGRSNVACGTDLPLMQEPPKIINVQRNHTTVIIEK